MAQTRQQKELIALAALVALAGSVWYLHLGKAAAPNGGFSAGNYSLINAQDYNVIIKGLEKAQGTEYKSAGRNIFVMGATRVEAAKQVAVKEPFRIVGPMLPAPPKPPELPWVFFGYGMLPAGGARQAFLKENSEDVVQVHIVSEGDVVLNHLRILHIGNEKIEFEDTETGLKNSKPLEVAPAT
jgi:hypothetical protein